METEILHIPHPQMEHRLFVLLPVQDLQTNWVHPKSGKNDCRADCFHHDKAIVKLSGSWKIHWKKSTYSSTITLRFEGNIGAGKNDFIHYNF